MKPSKFISQIRKWQILTDTPDRKLCEAVGWSMSTMRRRMKHPESITLGEADRIISYLGIK